MRFIVTGYTIDLRDLRENIPHVEFTARLFNGGVYTIYVLKVEGQIVHINDNRETYALTPPAVLQQPALNHEYPRHNEILVALRQEVTPEMAKALLSRNPKVGETVQGFSMRGITLTLRASPRDAKEVTAYPFADFPPFLVSATPA